MAAKSMMVFPFRSQEIRTDLDIDGNPWFCAKDVCAALEILNSRDAIAKLDDDERRDVGIPDAIGRYQPTSFISESGMYCLVLRSQDALEHGTTAYRFRKWVTAEVLPKLRKQGYYGQIKPSERLSAIKLSANLVERMARSTDMCEQAHLMLLNHDLCRSLGIDQPDIENLGKRVQALESGS